MTVANIYPAKPIDRNSINLLDIKCYDYPVTLEQWGQIISGDPGPFSGFSCEVFKRNGLVLGYFVYSNHPLLPEDGGLGDLFVFRIGVMPSVRKQGVGSMLVERILDLCQRKELAEFRVNLPEYFLDPSEGRGVEEFLKSNGLNYHETMKLAFLHYGKLYDGHVYRSGGNRDLVPA